MSDVSTPPDRPSEPSRDAVPAATVVLLRDSTDGIETLMLRRDTNLDFAGGMWVFPGGRVDPSDYPEGVDAQSADEEAELVAARNAAVRETFEEAGLDVSADDLVFFAHWTPAQAAARRFATWFFVVRAPTGAVVIDDGEIRAHEWVAPSEVLRRHGAGDISILPPTWMTLTTLDESTTVDAVLERMRSQAPVVYVSKIARTADGVTVAMWDGDAGYDDSDPDQPGRRHRLWLETGSWRLEHSP